MMNKVAEEQFRMFNLVIGFDKSHDLYAVRRMRPDVGDPTPRGLRVMFMSGVIWRLP